MFAATITPRSLNIFANGRRFTVDATHANFEAVKGQINAITQYYASPNHPNHGAAINMLIDLIDIKTFISVATEGRVQISNDEVRFDNKKVGGVIADRILHILNTGMDVRPMARFLERLMSNPNINAIDEMYLFLESGNMPITPDGCFLAYKYVRDDYGSCHAHPDGTHEPHRVGDTPNMPRENVDPDRDNVCSRGYHFCSAEYLNGNSGGGNHLMVLKVAPEDVVAIPSDYKNSKGRAWRYVVVAEIPYDKSAATRYEDKPIVEVEGEYDDSVEDEGEYDDFVEDEDYQGDFKAHEQDDPSNWVWTDENAVPITDAHDAPPVMMEIEPRITNGDPVSTPTNAEPVFKVGRKKVPASSLIQMVKDFGQRGAAKKLKIARSTIQGWIKKASS